MGVQERLGLGREMSPLKALASSLRAAQKRAKTVTGLPAAVLGEIAALIARVEALADATKRAASVGRRESGRLKMIA